MGADCTLIEPHIDGHDWLNLPTYSFLITHPTGAQVLFDLGCRKDWENLVPNVKEAIAQRVPGLKVKTEVPDILREGGVNVEKIKALILSHWHYDHSGNISRLHPSTDRTVGPEFKAAFEPGFPQSNSVFYEEDFEGRNVTELPFSDIRTDDRPIPGLRLLWRWLLICSERARPRDRPYICLGKNDSGYCYFHGR